MRKRIYKLFEDLRINNTNTISFYRKGKKNEKTFAEFAENIDEYLSRLNFLKTQNKVKTIAIIGPTSYDWVVCEYACIKGGFLVVAIPETFPKNEIENILKDTSADILFLDNNLKDKYALNNIKTYYIENYEGLQEHDFLNLPVVAAETNNIDKILEEYSIVFSSGTSEKVKYIKRTFPDIEKSNKSIIEHIRQIYQYVKYKRSFWAKKNNKVIIFMPFSHPQQRDFFRMALFRKINIVLSDPQNVLKHIILEKPNIMVSVPLIYEAMANRIKTKIERFSQVQSFMYKLFNGLRINALKNSNLLKRIISALLFKEIRKVYGGRADYFVTGSAPIAPEVIKTFFRVGVKLLQAYGQSETCNIAMNTPHKFKIGSVGKPLVEVKISDESEILVKYDLRTNQANKGILNIDENGFIHTGDLGYIDKDGFLFLTGRKDDIIVLENGKKIFPNKIEDEFKKYTPINDVFVFSEDGYKIAAVIDCTYPVKDSTITEIINEVNDKLLMHERIYKYHFCEEPFSIENGLLTQTYKKKRTKIMSYYSNKTFMKIA
jgi:long-chain acyl-CoA synthetase